MAAILPPIIIIGAGLSGLTLGLCLKHEGIETVIYDCAPSLPRYNYGISLHSSTYRPLLGILRMEEATFRQQLAVNAENGGTGSLSEADTFYCHRGRLQALLGDGLSISWDRRLRSIQFASPSKEIEALFDDGYSLRTTCLVGCDGPHSMARQSLSPEIKLEVLPYVVFNGKRRTSSAEYIQTLHKYMQDSVRIQTRKGKILLEISINESTTSYVDLSYTYSRPANGSNDPLHRPDRPIHAATDIPDQFYEEIASLQGLEPPFKSIFDVEKARGDRILHWLMRSLMPGQAAAERLANHGVVLIGDAVHATPIIGGDGANAAIKDGIDLAEHIARHGVDNLKDFSAFKFDEWKKTVDDSERRIKESHLSRTPSL